MGMLLKDTQIKQKHKDNEQNERAEENDFVQV
jgi:hypothetical protein